VLAWVRRGHTTRRRDGKVDVDTLDDYLAARPTHGPGSGFHRGAPRPGALRNQCAPHAERPPQS